MPKDLDVNKLQYVLSETSFYEFNFANILVENASGPIHPSASFTLYGSILLDEENTLAVHVSAKGANFSPEAGLERIEWLVTASLKQGPEEIKRKRIV